LQNPKRVQPTKGNGESSALVEILDAVRLAQVLHVLLVFGCEGSLFDELRIMSVNTATRIETVESRNSRKAETHAGPAMRRNPITIEVVPLPGLLWESRDKPQLGAARRNRTSDILGAAEVAVAATPLGGLAEHRVTGL
jgi:hypothetical protein